MNKKNIKRKSFFLYFCLFFCLFDFLFIKFGILQISFLYSIFLPILVFILFEFFNFNKNIRSLFFVFTLFLSFLFSLLFYNSFLNNLNTSFIKNNLSNTEKIYIEAEGFINKFPDRRFEFDYITLNIESLKINNKFIEDINERILIKTETAIFDFGDQLIIKGQLLKPFESQKFSYKNYLLKEGVYGVMYYPDIKLLQKDYYKNFLSWIYKLRKQFDAKIKQVINPPESALALGLLLGDRSGFSKIYEDYFVKTGLTHILALSGSNIMIVIIFVYFIFFWLPKNIRLFLTILFVIIFTFFVGGGASIVRACIMGILSIFILHFGKKNHSIYILVITIFFMIIHSPLVIAYDIGFQLSIAGVLGLVLFSSVLIKKINKIIKNNFISEIIAVTIAAQIATFPIVSYYFGSFSVISPVANLIIIPLIPLAMLFSFLSVVFSFLNIYLGLLFGFLTTNFLSILLFFIKQMSNLKFSLINFEFGLLAFFFSSIFIIAFWLFLNKKNNYL